MLLINKQFYIVTIEITYLLTCVCFYCNIPVFMFIWLFKVGFPSNGIFLCDSLLREAIRKEDIEALYKTIDVIY